MTENSIRYCLGIAPEQFERFIKGEIVTQKIPGGFQIQTNKKVRWRYENRSGIAVATSVRQTGQDDPEVSLYKL